ncbi:hypothetical protein FXE87_14455 [Vibrio mimicus]|uniref:hypothetical protein n=1 Tax=Vibrio mimicus TaxID=674 RepID=UPI0011DC3307|nr:hypothetical protein [Vibrio mimicus]TXY23464.1 hypothetical protein FXE87_14455 [Vibrio mimicus]
MYIRRGGSVRSAWKLSWVILLAVTGPVGCASNESMSLISEYAKQTSQVQEELLKVYQTADEVRINANLVEAARDGVTGKDLQFKTIDNAGQETLLQNLHDFSQSIYLLSTDDRGEALDNNSEKLNDSLMSLAENSQVNGIDSKQVEIISVSVNALARAYTERARYQYLKQILIDSQPVIQSSFDSLNGELEAWKTATKVSLEKELRIRLFLLNNPNLCESRDDAKCVNYYHSLEERVDAYRKAYALKSHIILLDTQFSKLEKALKAIQNLNISVVNSLNEDDDFSKSAVKKVIKSTQKQIDAIKEFRNKLKD